MQIYIFFPFFGYCILLFIGNSNFYSIFAYQKNSCFYGNA